jgi:hypothetical protein
MLLHSVMVRRSHLISTMLSWHDVYVHDSPPHQYLATMGRHAFYGPGQVLQPHTKFYTPSTERFGAAFMPHVSDPRGRQGGHSLPSFNIFTGGQFRYP